MAFRRFTVLDTLLPSPCQGEEPWGRCRDRGVVDRSPPLPIGVAQKAIAGAGRAGAGRRYLSTLILTVATLDVAPSLSSTVYWKVSVPRKFRRGGV